MKRRMLDWRRDYDQLLAMQRLSWEINFPGREFSEAAFDVQLRFGAHDNEVYIYELEGQLVGWLWLDWSVQRAGHIRHIQVEEAYWGQGLGRQILEDAIALCLQRDCRTLTLNVTKSNARAMTLYAHLGFVVADDHGDRQRMRLDLATGSPPRSGPRK
jgi:GNAT superfamily N-acetyltransferase